MIERPFFLVGSERSGSTMLRLMLDHHPRIACCSEFEYAVHYITASGEWPSLEAYYKALEEDRVYQSPENRFAVDRSLSYPELINSFLEQFRQGRGKGKPIVGATVHWGFDHLRRIWPDARFIHLVRDPRDVTRSVIQKRWAGNVWGGLDRWVESEDIWDRIEPTLAPEDFIQVRFEELVGQPEQELHRLCAFLGEPYDPAMLRYDQDSPYEAPNTNISQQWRRKLSERDIQLIEARVGDQMLARGYELSGLPQLQIDARDEQQLRRQDRWVRIRKRVEFLGPGLFTLDIASRKLGMAFLRPYVRRRVWSLVDEVVRESR